MEFPDWVQVKVKTLLIIWSYRKQEAVRHQIHLETEKMVFGQKKILEWGRSIVYTFPQFPSNLLLVTLVSFPHIFTVPAIVTFLGNSGESVKINEGQLIAIMLCTQAGLLTPTSSTETN